MYSDSNKAAKQEKGRKKKKKSIRTQEQKDVWSERKRKVGEGQSKTELLKRDDFAE